MIYLRTLFLVCFMGSSICFAAVGFDRSHSESVLDHRVFLVEFDNDSHIQVHDWLEKTIKLINEIPEIISKKAFIHSINGHEFVGVLVLVNNSHATAVKNSLSIDPDSQVQDLEAVINNKIPTVKARAKNLVQFHNSDFNKFMETSSFAGRLAMEEEINWQQSLWRQKLEKKYKVKVHRGILKDAVQLTLLDLEAVSNAIKGLHLPQSMKDLLRMISALSLQIYDNRLSLDSKIDINRHDDVRFLFAFSAHPFENKIEIRERVELVNQALHVGNIDHALIYPALADNNDYFRSLLSDVFVDYWLSKKGADDVFFDFSRLLSYQTVDRFPHIQRKMKFLSGAIQAISAYLMTAPDLRALNGNQKELLQLIGILRRSVIMFDTKSFAFDPGLSNSLSFVEGILKNSGGFRCTIQLR